jgi:hypothetical protein
MQRGSRRWERWRAGGVQGHGRRAGVATCRVAGCVTAIRTGAAAIRTGAAVRVNRSPGRPAWQLLLGVRGRVGLRFVACDTRPPSPFATARDPAHSSTAHSTSRHCLPMHMPHSPSRSPSVPCPGSLPTATCDTPSLTERRATHAPRPHYATVPASTAQPSTRLSLPRPAATSRPRMDSS